MENVMKKNEYFTLRILPVIKNQKISIFEKIYFHFLSGLRLLSFLFLFLLVNSSGFYAQNNPFPDTIKVDSADAQRKGLFDKENQKTFKVIFSGKPAKAALFSLIIPGGGQIYNKKYWKLPIVWGAVGYYGYVAVLSRNEYKKIDEIYRCALRGGNCSYKNYTNPDAIRAYRDEARNKSDRNWVTFSAIYLIQMIEAYVDRHLIDFDLNENLAFKTSINYNYSGIGLSYSIGKKPSPTKFITEF